MTNRIVKLNTSEIKGDYNTKWTDGTIFVDGSGVLRIGDGVTSGGNPIKINSLGNLVVYDDYGWALGTINGEMMRFNPNIEGWVDITLPSDTQANTIPLSISNSVGNIQLSSGGHNWLFGHDGNLVLPANTYILNSDLSTYGGSGSGAELIGASVAQVGSKVIIPTNFDGGLVGWNSTALSVAYDVQIIDTYPVGSTITWQDGTTATIVQVDNYGPTYIDIFWDTPKTGDLFPITLKTSNYVDAKPLAARIKVTAPGGPEQRWTFDANGAASFASNLTISPIGAYGIPITGTALYQGAGDSLQILASGVGGSSAIGWAETPFGPGNVAAVIFNDAPNGVYITSGNYSGNVYNWTFDQTGNLVIPGNINSVADTGNVVINSKGVSIHSWTFDVDGNVTVPGAIKSNNDLMLEVLGVPNGVTAVTYSSGSWDVNQGTNIATTGGSGIGLTVDVIADVSGYVGGITINTSGSGYLNGEAITVTSSSSTAIFTISVPTKTWAFTHTGNVTFPDNSIQTTAYTTTQTTVILDATTESGAAGYTFSGAAPAVIFCHPAGWYGDTNTQVIILQAPTYPGQKVSVINNYGGQITLNWPWGPGTNSTTLNAYENSELTAVTHPDQGLTYWETNRYSW